jgi:hypothetical protein
MKIALHYDRECAGPVLSFTTEETEDEPASTFWLQVHSDAGLLDMADLLEEVAMTMRSYYVPTPPEQPKPDLKIVK